MVLAQVCHFRHQVVHGRWLGGFCFQTGCEPDQPAQMPSPVGGPLLPGSIVGERPHVCQDRGMLPIQQQAQFKLGRESGRECGSEFSREFGCQFRHEF